MACLRPIKIPNKRYTSNSDVEFVNQVCEFYNSLGYVNPPDRYIEVPCGKCYGCLKSKRNGWRIRLMAEFFGNPHTAFITLTFNDESLDRFKDNPNKSVRLFLDRLRKNYSTGVKHFVIAEFGEDDKYTHRLHYHGMLFNLLPGKPLDSDMLADLWKYGYVYVGYCNQKTINYVTKYITKVPPPGKKLPRLIVSKGIGSFFLQQYGVELAAGYKPYFSSNGFKIALPRYYIDKLFDKATRVCMQYYMSLQPFLRFVDGRSYCDVATYRKALADYYAKLKSISVEDLSVPPPEYTTGHRVVLDEYEELFGISLDSPTYVDSFDVTPF